MGRRKAVSETLLGRNHFPTDPDFTRHVRGVEAAIRSGIHPQLIHQGSSGSYFARNETGETVGVFKPRNEEPFAHMNPKWQKYVQRVCSPCCFGRSCLLHNQGYLSEAGASLVDTKLGLNIVPRTKVVELSSMAFYYTRNERNKQVLPAKVGSFQLYVKGHDSAGTFIQQVRMGNDGHKEFVPSQEVLEKFKILYQKMVVLDYVIRNTDRSDDNWLIQYRNVEGTEEIKIAAIDNGLAFPYKHPDQWRHYPFYFATFDFPGDFSACPFVDEVKNLILPKLENPRFVQALIEDLRELFKKDPSFDKRLFERQMGVMRGQIWNLKVALSNDYNPASLAGMTKRIGVPKRRILKGLKLKEAEGMRKGETTWDEMFRVLEASRRPCFNCC